MFKKEGCIQSVLNDRVPRFCDAVGFVGFALLMRIADGGRGVAASLGPGGVSGEGSYDGGPSGPPQSRLCLELSVFRLQVLGCVGVLIVRAQKASVHQTRKVGTVMEGLYSAGVPDAHRHSWMKKIRSR